MGKFDKAKIPDEAHLHRRVICHHIKNDGSIKAGGFGPITEDSLSVEWDKYATPEQTRFRMCTSDCPEKQKIAKSLAKKFGVCSIITKEVRNLDLKVKHSPSWNPAHSSIIGMLMFKDIDRLGIRLRLANQAKLVLRPLF